MPKKYTVNSSQELNLGRLSSGQLFLSTEPLELWHWSRRSSPLNSNQLFLPIEPLDLWHWSRRSSPLNSDQQLFQKFIIQSYIVVEGSAWAGHEYT